MLQYNNTDQLSCTYYRFYEHISEMYKKKFVQNILTSKPSLLVAFTVRENQVFSKLASVFYCNNGTDGGILLKAKSHNNEDKIIS
jgi:hypothetical protein